MNERILITISVLLSFVGGVLNFLIAIIRLADPTVPWFLACLSGLGIIVAVVFTYISPRHRRIWGGIVFFYSNLAFIPFGLSSETQLLPYGFATLIFGLISGAINIHLGMAS